MAGLSAILQRIYSDFQLFAANFALCVGFVKINEFDNSGLQKTNRSWVYGRGVTDRCSSEVCEGILMHSGATVLCGKRLCGKGKQRTQELSGLIVYGKRYQATFEVNDSYILFIGPYFKRSLSARAQKGCRTAEYSAVSRVVPPPVESHLVPNQT